MQVSIWLNDSFKKERRVAARSYMPEEEWKGLGNKYKR